MIRKHEDGKRPLLELRATRVSAFFTVALDFGLSL